MRGQFVGKEDKKIKLVVITYIYYFYPKAARLKDKKIKNKITTKYRGFGN